MLEGVETHAFKGVWTGVDASWNGLQRTKSRKKSLQILWKSAKDAQKTKSTQLLTPFAHIGRKPSVFCAETISWLLGASCVYGSVEFLQLWSTKRVLMSGFCLGFAQRECCQFKLYVRWKPKLVCFLLMNNISRNSKINTNICILSATVWIHTHLKQ